MQHQYLDAAYCQRLVRTYGTEAKGILAGAKSIADLGRHFGASLYERELRHMIEKEWVTTGDDALWRRTKLGLRLSPDEATAVDRFIRDETRP